MAAPDAPDPPSPEAAAIRATVHQEIARVQTPEAADAVVQQAEQIASGKTEESAGQAAEKAPSAAEHVEQAAHGPSSTTEVARVLTAAAAESVSPRADAQAVLEAIHVPPGQEPLDPRVRHGRRLLREAVLRRMGPFQALDARLYLAVNEASHPEWLDRAAYGLSLICTGGWIWIFGTLVAALCGAPDGWRGVRAVLPVVTLSTSTAEYPVKAYFRRRRPFVHIVRALVVGKKPGSWSFPSGHTAASFSAALAVSSVWPRWAPVFFGLASLVGASRVYVGAHYPGDVLSGAALGLGLGEPIRRIASRLLG